MIVITITCPYCAASNQAGAFRSGFFVTECFSCTCEYGCEVELPDYSGTFKMAGVPEIVPANLEQYFKSLKK